MNEKNNQENDWESEMSREFDHRVRDLNEAPFSLDHVKGKAMTIQRNRRLVVAGGILAAAAVIVPVAVFAGQGLGGTDSTPKVPVASSSNSPNPAPTTATDPIRPDPSDPPVATGITVDYLEGKTWVRPDGSTVELDSAYSGGTMLGTTLLGVRNDNGTGTYYLDVIDPTGEVSESIEFVSGLAVNDEHTTVSYLEPDGDLMTLWDPTTGDKGRVAIATGLSPDVSPVAILGGPSCYEVEDSCTVFFNYGDAKTPPQSASSHGITDEFVFTDPPPIKVTDAAPDGLRTIQKSYSDDGSCNGIYDASSSAYVFETCKNYLLGLNPSGSHVVATSAYFDGIGLGYLAIFDTAGTEVVRIAPGTQGFVNGSFMWEDDDSLLATVYQSGKWSIWRLGVDGSKEQIVGPSSEGDDTMPAYTLLGGA